MAYFVRIGAIPHNQSGVGSRGYHIFRRGKRVFAVWGPVEVRRGRRFYWCATRQYVQHNCRSTGEAIALRGELVAKRTAATGYSRLPAGAIIRIGGRDRGKVRQYR
jgi:hypothetical protein